MGEAAGSAPLTEAAPAAPLHSGWLHKRGHLNPKYKKRWFVLTDSLKLSYYEAPGDPGRNKPKGEVRPSLPQPVQGVGQRRRCLDGGLCSPALSAPSVFTRSAGFRPIAPSYSRALALPAAAVSGNQPPPTPHPSPMLPVRCTWPR